MYTKLTAENKYSTRTRMACCELRRSANKTRPMKVGRAPRNEIISVHFSVGNPSNMDTTGRNPRYHAACETMKATPTTTVEEPHEVTLVPMVRLGRRYKRHIRTHMQHGRGTRRRRHCVALTAWTTPLPGSVPPRPRGPRSPLPPPHTWTRPEEEGRSRRTCAAGQAYRDVAYTPRHNMNTGRTPSPYMAYMAQH